MFCALDKPYPLVCAVFAAALSAVAAPGPFGRFVDPFVGTEGTGHTTPAASYPFGLVQAGPDSGRDDWAHCSGYRKDDAALIGFSQTHLNGTGVPDLGDMRFLPYTGPVRRREWKVRKDAAREKAEPGYYGIVLPEEGLQVEAVALSKSAVWRITPETDGTVHLFFDQEGCIGDFAAYRGVTFPKGFVHSDGDRAFDAYYCRNGWVTNREVYARFVFSHPFSVSAEFPCKGRGNAVARRVYDFALRRGDALEIRIALSASSSAAARRNLAMQLAGKSFAAVRAEAFAAWEAVLALVELKGASEEQSRNFYTALYHLYQQPNDLADAGEPLQCSTLSMWDVFRAACPWYALMKPDVMDGIVASCLRQYDETGYLPVWQLWGKDNHCMIGNHAIPVIVDAYLKGFRGFDAERAYTAVTNTLTVKHPDNPKENWDLYDRYGYYPCDVIRGESVSRTMECSYDDWCASVFAQALGKADGAAFFAKRAAYWKNVFDPSIKFGRGKTTKGTWRTPFDPYAFGHGNDRDNDFTEGNAFQYTWHVLQDPEGLVAAMGGKAEFTKRLDSLFTSPDTLPDTSNGQNCDITGLIGQYVHGNEPSHHVIYFYPYVGEPRKAARRIRDVFDRFYFPGPTGLCGNDDCGQMSAWYIFSALGFYPFNPCGGDYVLGAPQLPKAVLDVGGGKTFTVVARNFSKENLYVKSVTLNGRPLDGFILKHADVVKGGELVFEMGR